MTSNRDALFKAILGNPDEDAARLVYADCIEENGEGERAAFIRAQIAAEVLPMYSSERIRLESQADAIRTEHGISWRVQPPPDGNIYEQQYERGFVNYIEMAMIDYLENSDYLHEQSPLTSLKLTAIPVPIPYLENLQKQLAKRPDVQALDLERCGINPPDANPNDVLDRLRVIAKMKHLRTLNLSDNGIGTGYAPTLITQAAIIAGMHHLHSLNLSSNYFFDTNEDQPTHGMSVLRTIAEMENLQHLDMSQCELAVGNNGLERLKIITGMNNLISFSMRNDGLGAYEDDDQLAEKFQAIGKMQNLRQLDLCGNVIGDDVEQYLVPILGLRNLEILNLRDNGIRGDDAYDMIAQAELPRLTALDIRSGLDVKIPGKGSAGLYAALTEAYKRTYDSDGALPSPINLEHINGGTLIPLELENERLKAKKAWDAKHLEPAPCPLMTAHELHELGIRDIRR